MEFFSLERDEGDRGYRPSWDVLVIPANLFWLENNFKNNNKELNCLNKDADHGMKCGENKFNFLKIFTIQEGSKSTSKHLN